MKPPFQYPRRAEADNFRTKVKLVRSAFRSPIYHGWFASAAERTRLIGKWVFFGSDRPSKPILEFGSSKPQACHGPRPGFLCRLCGWGSRCASASKLQKMGGFHSDPIAADGFWGRAHLRRLCPHPAGAQRAVGRGLHHLGLRDLAEPGFSGSRGFFVWRFLKTGGLAMLRMMNRPASPGHAHHHAH
jgi:hypothetical protein